MEAEGHASASVAGSVTVSGGRARLSERESFVTSLQQVIDIPADAELLTLDLVAAGLEVDGIPDVFEISLLDDNFQSLVPTHQPFATSFFNLNPGGTVSSAGGVTFDGTTVTLDLSSVAGTSAATLYIDLIGNTSGTTSTAVVDNVTVTPELVFTDTFTTVMLPGGFSAASDVSVADVDGDSFLDVVVADSTQDLIAVFNGDGGTGWIRDDVDVSGFGSSPVSIVTAVLTSGDNVEDIAAALFDSDVVLSPLGRDLVAPTVELTSPTPDVTTSNAVTDVMLAYSESMRDVGADASLRVSNPTNYELVNLGPNGVYDNGLGDDEVVSLDSAVYSTNSTTVTLNPAASSSSLPDGAYQLTVYADDGSQGVSDVSGNPLNDGVDAVFQFAINQNGPVVDPVADITANEGETGSVSATFTDPGGSSPYTAEVNWGDGTTTQATVTFENGVGTIDSTHEYTDDGSYQVTVSVSDQAGTTGSGQAGASVSNVSPSVSPPGSVTVGEGQSTTVSTTFTDPGTGDNHTATIDWGDGTTSPGTVTFENGNGTIEGTHTYENEGVYTVTVGVSDNGGGLGSGSGSSTVTNNAPVPGVVTLEDGAEGSPVSLSVPFTDAGTADTHTATIDWGDGTTSTGTVTESNGQGNVTASHTYADNNIYTTTVVVTDDAGAGASSEAQSTISNAGPTTVSAPDTSANSGQSSTFNLASFSDPGFGVTETFTAIVNWGDGSLSEAASISLTDGSPGTATVGQISGDHAFAAAGTYIVTITVSDDDGGNDTAIMQIEVIETNFAPMVNDLSPESIHEGALASVTTSFTDQGDGGGHTATIDWGDGTSITGLVDFDAVTSTGTVSGSHVYADDGNYIVTVAVTDNSDASGSGAGTIPVFNVAPGLVDGNDAVVERAAQLSTTIATFSDPSFSGDEVYSGTIDWGDGTTTNAVVDYVNGSEGVATTGSISGSHTWSAVGTYTVTTTLTDGDGGSATADITVTVTATAPLVVSPDPVSAVEGDSVSLSGSFSASASGSPFAATIDWGDGSSSGGIVSFDNGLGTVEGNHTYADNGSYDVFVVVSNAFEESDQADTTAAISNATPILTVAANQSATINDTLSFTAGTFSDSGFTNAPAGTSETFTATIDWGDGSAVESGTVTTQQGAVGIPTTGSIDGDHQFATAGTYAVTVTLTDDDSATSSDTFSVVVTNPANLPSAAGPSETNEGSTYTLILDPGGVGTTEWSIDWGDGSFETVAATTESVTHVYADGFTQSIIVATATDGNDTWSTQVPVDVQNINPTLTVAGDGVAVLGSEYTVNLLVDDPGEDVVTHWLIDWGDGSTPQLVTENPSTVSYLYADAGSYEVTTQAWDDDRPYDLQTEGYFANTHLVAVHLPENAWLPEIDFENDANGVPLYAGETITDQFADWGLHVTTDDPGNHPAMIFDSASPTGGDHDLETPGRSGHHHHWWNHGNRWHHRRGHGHHWWHHHGPHQDSSGNTEARQNVLIISEDANSSDPDDNATGGTFIFTFDHPSMVDEIGLLDIEESGGEIRIFNTDGSLQQTIAIPALTNNSWQLVDISAVDVGRMEVGLAGSGAITDLVFCRESHATSVTLTGTEGLNEGDIYQLTLDSGAIVPDAWQIDWGDGTPVETVPGHTTSLGHVYADNLASAITAQAVSSTGQMWFANPISIDVANVVPEVIATGAGIIGKGMIYTLDLSATDPGDDTITSWVVDWGDGNSDIIDGSNTSVQHVYSQSGTFTIDVSVYDEDGWHEGTTTGITVTSPTTGRRFFVVDSQDDQFYTYNDSGDTIGHFSLQPSRQVRGVTTIGLGNPLWTIDRDCTVYVYDSVGENLLGSWHAHGLRNPEGIATDGTDIWIVDKGRDRIFRYSGAAALRGGSHHPDSSIRLNRSFWWSNRNPSGITTDGNLIWVTDDSSDRVFVYKTSGQYLGSWRLDYRNRHPSGITIDPNGGTDIWVVDRQDDRVYHYENGTTFRSGNRSATDSFGLDSRNSRPEGIADPTFPYSLNDVVVSDISVVGEQDEYQFTGTAGQNVFFDIQSVTGGRGHFFLKQPNGSNLAGYSTTSSSGVNENDGFVTLPVDGTYTVLAESLTGETPMYQLVVYEVPDPDIAIAQLDTTYTGQIDTPGHSDEWLIDLTAGQTIKLDVFSAGPGYARMTIAAPDGTLIHGGLAGDSDSIELTQTGTYVYTVDGIRDDIPAYEFVIRDVAPVIRQTAIGKNESATLSSSDIPDIWQFTAVADQEIFLQWNDLAGSVSYSIVAPDGTNVFGGLGNTTSTLQRGSVLPLTGQYEIVIGGLADYEFTLWDVPAPDVYQVQAGDVGLGFIEGPGRRDIFEFEGFTGQEIYIDFQGNSGWIEWEFVQPDGTPLDTASAFLTHQLDGGPMTLPVDGTYRLNTSANRDSTGSFDFRIFDITPTTPTPIVFDQIVTNSLNRPGQTIEYTIDATAGQDLQLDVLYNDASTVAWRVESPSGTVLISNQRGDQTLTSLTETGAYLIAVDEFTSAADDTTGQFSFRIVDPAVTPPLPDPSDLVVTSVIRPTSIVGNPASFDVTWTVENQGTGTTDVGSWTDRIYLSKNQTFERALEIVGAETVRTGSLASGESYTQTTTIILPEGFEGDLTVVVEADAFNENWEFLDEDNNVSVQDPSAVYRKPLENGPPSIKLNVDDGAKFPVGSTVVLSGVATVLPATANLVFAVDLSSSTGAGVGSDANFDGIADDNDDLNGDGSVGDVLDVEIGSLLRIVQNLRDNNIDARVAVVPFATFVESADLSPLFFNQTFHSPTADDNNNGIFDIDEAVLTMTAGSMDLFRNIGLSIGTNFADTINEVDEVLNRSIDAQKTQVFFLTDGSAGTPDIADIERVAGRGIDFYGYQITGTDVTGPLQTIADTIDADPSSTGQTQLIADPEDLAASLLQSLEIVGVSVDGAGAQTLDSAGNFFAPVTIEAGANSVTVQAVDSEGNVASRTITLIGIEPDAVPTVADMNDVSASGDITWTGSTFNRSTSVLHTGIQLTNTSTDILDPPVLAVFDSLNPLSVDLTTADGNTTDTGATFVDFTSTMSATGLNPGETTLLRVMEFHNPQHERFNFDISLRALGNQAPFFTSAPITEAVPGNVYTDTAAAEDPEAHTLTWNLVTGPGGLSLDSATGQITWTPTVADVGSHDVEIEVSDGRGGRATRTVQLVVRDNVANRPPVFTTAPVNEINSGSDYLYDVDAFDVDGNAIAYSLDLAPAGTTINASTGVISLLAPADGEYTIIVRASDGVGGDAVQQFTLAVGVVASNPNAPVILSTPLTVAVVDELYLYLPLAQDPDGDALTWSLIAAPAGMTIDSASGRIDWTPGVTQFGNASVILQVDDGLGGVARQFFTIEIFTEAPNRAPRFLSAPTFFATIDEAYSSEVLAVDPEGSPVSYELVSGPSTMVLNTTPALVGSPLATIDWTPTTADLGTHVVELKATDPDGEAALQTFILDVRGVNTAPTITTSPLQSVVADTVYRYDVDAIDAEDAVRFQLAPGGGVSDQVPAGLTIDAVTGQIEWTTGAADIGSYPLTVRAIDDRGLIDEQTFTLNVVADVEGPTVSIQLSDNVVDPSEPVTITVEAIDNVGVDVVTLTIDGVVVPLDANNQAIFTPTSPGLPQIIAGATDVNGNVGTDSATLRVVDPTDTTAPVITVTSPQPSDVVTYLTDIVGSITDDNLESYEVAHSPAFAEQWTTFVQVPSPRGEGQGEGGGLLPNISNGTIATFDPTMLMNNSYDVRIKATDISGNISTFTFLLSVEGQAKIGNFQLQFNDLTIPLAGIPITITRSYDTLMADKSGDFGYGWMMGLAEGGIRETRPSVENESLFNNVPFRAGTRVYINAPGGRRIGFTFDPIPEATLLGTSFTPNFVADPGVYERLEVENLPLRQNPDGTFKTYFGGYDYNPRVYTLITKDQVRYTYDQYDGLLSVSNRNDVTLEYTDAGIFSSLGESVTWQRDDLGRVTTITDPAGNKLHYEYDAVGDLRSATDRLGGTTTMGYLGTPAHYLRSVTDRYGVEALQLEYDESGRLIGQVDALGASTTQSYDVAGNQEVIGDREGNETVLTFDDRGNVVAVETALGATVGFEHDAFDNLSSVTDERGYTTEFEYDEAGNQTAIIDALGNQWSYSFTVANDLKSLTDPLGNTASFNYDDAGNLTSATNVGGFTRHATYDGNGRITTDTDYNGNATQFEYGLLDLPTKIEYADGTTRLTSYSNLGLPISVVDSNGNAATTIDYDVAGQPLSITDADGNSISMTWDGRRLVSMMDVRGNSNAFEYDDAGRNIQSIDALGNLSAYSYDANDRVTSFTDAEGRIFQYEYNALAVCPGSGANRRVVTGRKFEFSVR